MMTIISYVFSAQRAVLVCTLRQVMVEALSMEDVVAVELNHIVCLQEVLDANGALVVVDLVSISVWSLVFLDEVIAVVLLFNGVGDILELGTINQSVVHYNWAVLDELLYAPFAEAFHRKLQYMFKCVFVTHDTHEQHKA